MNVTIIGLVHDLQTSDQRFFSTSDLPRAEANDKARYRRLLAGLLARGARVVGEEWLPPPDTIAHNVASLHAARHAYVDMPVRERHARGIPDDYAVDPGVSATQRAAWHTERERFMVEGLLRVSADSPVAVMICGADHTAGIAHLLVSHGHAVESVTLDQAHGFDLRWLDS
jgi:hypothetical protein